MDGISGITSFITIAELLHRLYRTLKRYAKGLAIAATEAKGLAVEVSNFAGLLLLVEDTFNGLQGVMQRSYKFMKVEKSHIANANALVDGLEELTKGLPTLLERGQGNFFQKWLMRHRWVAMKSHVQDLRFSVETSKSSLILLLQIVQVENLKEQLSKLLSEKAINQLQHEKQVTVLKNKM